MVEKKKIEKEQIAEAKPVHESEIDIVYGIGHLVSVLMTVVWFVCCWFLSEWVFVFGGVFSFMAGTGYMLSRLEVFLGLSVLSLPIIVIGWKYSFFWPVLIVVSSLGYVFLL